MLPSKRKGLNSGIVYMYFTAHNHQVIDIKFNHKIVTVQKKWKDYVCESTFLFRKESQKIGWSSFDFHLFLSFHYLNISIFSFLIHI